MTLAPPNSEKFLIFLNFLRNLKLFATRETLLYQVFILLVANQTCTKNFVKFQNIMTRIVAAKFAQLEVFESYFIESLCQSNVVFPYGYNNVKLEARPPFPALRLHSKGWKISGITKKSRGVIKKVRRMALVAQKRAKSYPVTY